MIVVDAVVAIHLVVAGDETEGGAEVLRRAPRLPHGGGGRVKKRSDGPRLETK